MWTLIALILAQVEAQPARTAKASPTTSGPSMLEGPLRIELVGLGERRTLDALNTEAAGTRMRLQFRVRGADLAQLKRHGNLHLMELVDDLGNNLLATPPTDEAATRRVDSQTLAKIGETGLGIGAETKAAPRAAKKLTLIRGQVRAVFGDAAESVYIDDPRQYMGRVIDHPRLKELGVEIRALGQADITQLANSQRHVPIQYVRGEEMIDEIAFCDPWLKPIRVRHYRDMKTASNESCQVYLAEFDINAEHCMVIRVFPRVRDERIPLELRDVDLP